MNEKELENKLKAGKQKSAEALKADLDYMKGQKVLIDREFDFQVRQQELVKKYPKFINPEREFQATPEFSDLVIEAADIEIEKIKLMKENKRKEMDKRVEAHLKEYKEITGEEYDWN